MNFLSSSLLTLGKVDKMFSFPKDHFEIIFSILEDFELRFLRPDGTRGTFGGALKNCSFPRITAVIVLCDLYLKRFAPTGTYPLNFVIVECTQR